MSISKFIILKRQVKRLLNSFTLNDRTVINNYIELLEDELVTITKESQNLLKSNEISLKTYRNKRSKYTNKELNQNMLLFYKSHKYKIPFKYLEYSVEFNKAPFDKKFKKLEDIEWLESNYPLLYKGQKKLAYFRVNQKYKLKKNS